MGEIDPVGRAITKVVQDFTLGSGKRIRAALVAIGYRAAEEKTTKRILLPAIAIELMHSFFLIHDDIIDRSDLRRNRPTVHRIFEHNHKILLDQQPDVDRKHFAHSMAVLAGDLCCALAYEALVISDFPADHILAVIKKIHGTMDATLVGQTLDILQPLEKNVSEKDVSKIHLLKTAQYTFESPLHTGMIFGGASDELLHLMSDYAIPVGIAFQIQDDVLGLFGSEHELGKPVTSDLEEGKQTLLTVFVREHGTQSQRKTLESCLGKQEVSLNDLENIREIIRDTGALAHCQKRAHELIMQGKASLDHISLPAEIQTILLELADYVISRTV